MLQQLSETKDKLVQQKFIEYSYSNINRVIKIKFQFFDFKLVGG